ncbi:MAG: class I SAM-dependent methyltransferase [Deltaproteobacteria bacterium]|nr:class I SAM-dependent methyltransferase [Deltaproteobacteria bacterium]MBI4796000.1 class I SAM-dependent methyltransferase [Deltaproteobacteria bacterium]
MTSPFFRVELEPPPWLYHLMARGPFFKRVYRLFLADLTAALPPGAGLLDVGTGPGFLLDYLFALRPDLRVFGLDLSHQMLRRGQRRRRRLSLSPWPGVVAQAEDLPFAAGVFDQTLATFSFHIWRRPAKGVVEISRVLKPGGRAWFYEMNREASSQELRRFATSENIPFPLVFFGFRTLSWHHALRAKDFARVFREAGIGRWHLEPAHHLFWRAEIEA